MGQAAGPVGGGGIELNAVCASPQSSKPPSIGTPAGTFCRLQVSPATRSSVWTRSLTLSGLLPLRMAEIGSAGVAWLRRTVNVRVRPTPMPLVARICRPESVKGVLAVARHSTSPSVAVQRFSVAPL